MTSSTIPRPVRWGILGAGAIAARFARDLAHVPGASVGAVFARRPEQATALAAAHPGSRATSALDRFFASDLDAVYVATLPDTHHRFARAALLAGLPVLCEKPVTRSLAELEDLLTLATERRLLFMEAMKTPFLPLYQQLRTRLAGELGAVRLIVAGNAVPHTPPEHPSWSSSLAGGALLSIGVYGAFLAVDWLGPARSVQAISRFADPSHNPQPSTGRASHSPSYVVDALTLLQSQHDHGLAQIHAGLDLASPGTATLAAADGFALIHRPWWNPSRATITPASGSPVELHLPFAGDGLHFEAAHFVDLLHTGKRQSPIVSHAHSRAVMHLLHQARAAVNLRFPGEDAPPAPALPPSMPRSAP